ncbi:hypothetical protein [Rhizobium sp. F40D2]
MTMQFLLSSLKHVAQKWAAVLPGKALSAFAANDMRKNKELKRARSESE